MVSGSGVRKVWKLLNETRTTLCAKPVLEKQAASLAGKSVLRTIRSLL